MIEYIRSENFLSGFYFVLFVVSTFTFIGIRHSEVIGQLTRATTWVLVAAGLMTIFGFVVIAPITKDWSHLGFLPFTSFLGYVVARITTSMENERVDNKSKRRSIHHAKD
ncbi:hypothetical protein CPT_Moabite_277 [Serratia phage Moabite]|uniref:Holin n=3 Tax=Moabitevirus TaxID=2843422 RepID=A0A7T3NC25_9CAUD|nr:hypothetical protein HWB23_gp207 [Serratia phage vB_SmaM_ 2050HW]YP_009849371.1 hypothetical protein HWC48_gp139 [Serratia phage Moabite]QPX76877.1 hypothetical protein [Serratia phage vB_SmaM_Yaphecito]UGO54160.1 hypothetical protein HAYMO_178 [Serratia phage vB_SmaM_Haymo]ATA65542.1 hypothetical protein 2050HW_00207 [Serratia phage vB_SmaM_ 2050HW]QDB71307.1 hypothetical protein CPT_Moabite_277 [Serratia phage Moabite]